jgi:hypothetical protein
LLADIIDKETAEDTPKRDEVIQKRKKLLEENELFRLKDWAALSTDDKNKYPDGLKLILNKACQSGKLFLKHNSFISNTIKEIKESKTTGKYYCCYFATYTILNALHDRQTNIQQTASYATNR